MFSLEKVVNKDSVKPRKRKYAKAHQGKYLSRAPYYIYFLFQTVAFDNNSLQHCMFVDVFLH